MENEMRILIVDDMEDRHRVFKKLYGLDHLLIHAYTYDEGLVEINANPHGFDVMFLDHDLSLESILCNPYNCEEKTGSDLAKEIVEIVDPSKLKKHFAILCHSLNPDGAENMHNIFKDNNIKSIIAPFTLIANGGIKLTK